MMTQTTPRMTTLATMIRHATTMTTRRIIDDSLCIEIMFNFVKATNIKLIL